MTVRFGSNSQVSRPHLAAIGCGVADTRKPVPVMANKIMTIFDDAGVALPTTMGPGSVFGLGCSPVTSTTSAIVRL